MLRRSCLVAVVSLLAVLALLAAPCFGGGPEIRGRVVQDESPVVGAWVELTPLVGRWQLGDLFFQGKTRPDPVGRAVTAADGSFTLRAPVAGMWRLTVGAEGRVPVQLSVVPLYRDVELDDAVLAADHGVTVRVVDPAGQPLPAAAVLGYGSGASRRGRNGLPEPTWQRATELAFTGDDGRARLAGFRGETLRLQVAEPGHPSAAAEIRLPLPGEMEIALERGRRLTVRAVDASDEPLVGALVWSADQPFPVGWTGEDGRTSMVLHRSAPSAPSGDSIRLLGLTESGARVVGVLSTSSPVGSLRLRFRRPDSFRGRVLRQGTQEPVEGALVWSWYEPDRFVRSDSDGWFHLDAVGSGAVKSGAYVSAVRAGYRPSGLHLPEGDGADAGPAVVQLTAVGGLEGRVVDARGEAVPGLGLRLDRRDVSWSGREPWPQRSGADGAFRLVDVPVDVDLLMTLGGVDAMGRPWAEVVRPVEPLAAGELRKGVVLQASRGLAAVGWVVDEADAPVAGAQVRLLDVDPQRRALRLPGTAREAHSVDDGSWQMVALRPGVYEMVVRATGFAQTTVPGVWVGSDDDLIALMDGSADPKSTSPGSINPGSVDPETYDLGTVVLLPGASLEGWVTDGDRQPVAGAEVRGWESGRSELGTSTVTDDQGRFVLRDLRGGSSVSIAARHPHYLRGSIGPISVPQPGELADEVEIVLERGTAIRGRVSDELGRPVARASVALFGQGGGGSARGGQSTTVTERQGSFELHQVPAGPATLQVSHRDYPRHSEPVQLLPAHLGVTEVDVVLQSAAGGLRGVVRDADGGPVAAALVLLPGDGVARSASTRTDAGGAFEMTSVDPGLRELVIHHAAFASYRDEVDVTGNSWIEVELERGVSMSGHVVDGNGAPLAGARIDTTPLDVAGQATREGAISAADGSWTVERLVPGRYRPRARREGYYAPVEADPVELDADRRGVVLELVRGVTLVGRVEGVAFDDLPSVSIRAQRLTSDVPTYPLPLSADLDFEGGFRLAGLSPGTWQVTATSRTSGAQRSVRIEVGRTPPASVVLRLGDGVAVSGTVRIYGMPAAWSPETLRIILQPAEQRPGGGVRPVDPGGRFEILDVAPGAYRISVLCNSGRLWHREVDVYADVDLEIEVRVGRLAGTVRDRLGRPLGDVHVVLIGSALDARNLMVSTSTGDDGRFRVDLAPVDDYAVRLAREGFSFAGQTLTLTEGAAIELELVMDAAGSLTSGSKER